MKNRKTITFDQDILQISKALEPEERKEFFLQLVEHFLEDKQFPETVSPCMKVALAAASPTIRKLQSKFLNGICTKETFCHKNESETKPTEATAPAHMYNNQSTNKNKISSSINFNTTNQPTNVINNNTNIYNNISTYISYIKNNQNLSVEQIKNPLNYERRVAEALNQLRTQEPQTFLNFNNTFDFVLKNEKIKISGASHSQQEIVSVILDLLIKPDGFQTVRELSNELESTLGVRNKCAYFLTMLWNRAKNLSQTVQNKSKPNFEQRTYTKEQCDAFYDNLDDIDV